MFILRSLKLEPNHAYGISQFLQQQSDSEFLVDNGSLYPALQRLLQREWISAQWENYAKWAPRPVLQPDAGRTQATGQGNFEVAAICSSNGKDSGTGGLISCANGRRRSHMHSEKGENLANELRAGDGEAHLQFLIDANLERGIPTEEARAAARRHFGNATTVRERSYQSWQFPTFESLLQDLRYAARGIWRVRAFSLIVILTLAVGIGANTAIFSAVYAVLLKPLPFPSGERLVWLGESSAKATGISVTWINFEHWRIGDSLLRVDGWLRKADLTLTGRGQAVLTTAGVVTSEFFRLTGSRPIMGRLFIASDDEPQSAATVVVTRAFWAKTLSADPQIIGKTITLNGTAYISDRRTCPEILASSCSRSITIFHSVLPLRRLQSATNTEGCACWGC